MPKLNSLGKWCAGIGGTQASYEGEIVGQPAGGTSFVDDTHVIFSKGPDPYHLVIHDITTGINVDASTLGANELKAGGGVWAAWLSGYGLFTSAGLHLENAGLADVGPDGAICIKADYLGFGPYYVRETNGDEWSLTAGDASNIQLLGNGRAQWQEGGTIRTIGDVPMPTLGEHYAVHMALVGSIWWCVYAVPGGPLVAHPNTDANNPIAVHGADAEHFFAVDCQGLSDGRIAYVYSRNEGEAPGEIIRDYIDTGSPGGSAGGSNGSGSAMAILTSSATFTVVDASPAIALLTIPSLPAWPVQSGRGRIVHPILGPFDYEVKPDEWVNIDADVVIAPVWGSTRTLVSAANVLWQGHIRDVVVEERWKALGGLAMPIAQLRMLLMIWTNPIDPATGYVQWYPNYISPLGYNVLPVGLQVGGAGITFDDVGNYADENGPDGWVTNSVTFTLKLVERLTP